MKIDKFSHAAGLTDAMKMVFDYSKQFEDPEIKLLLTQIGIEIGNRGTQERHEIMEDTNKKMEELLNHMKEQFG